MTTPEEPEGVQMCHGEDVATELSGVEKVCSEEGVKVLIKLSTLEEYELFRFYESGGVHTYCNLMLGATTEDADDVDAKLMFMITAQTLLSIGQIRSMMILRDTILPLSDMACNLLRMTGIEGGTDKDLQCLHLEAAGCLNMLPLPLYAWCSNDIPALCMELLADKTFLEDSSEIATGGPTNLVDAGLLLVGNFLSSREFFDTMLDAGVVEAVVRVGELLTEEVYSNPLYQFTIIRFLTVVLVLVDVQESKAKLEFIDNGLSEDESLIRNLLPLLATHTHITIRSLAHQVLADYTGVNEPRHDWITTTPEVTSINQSSSAFNKKRPCSNPLCTQHESLPLEYAWCSKCKVTAYCTPDCQKTHWAVHKKVCKTLIIKEEK